MAGKTSMGAWGAAALLLIAACAIRFPLIEIPLDRDEGGYAYGAQRILDGGATYVDFYTMRYPAIFGAYAVLLRVFGETHGGVHLGLLIVNAITGVLLFLTARRWFGDWAAVAALGVFLTLSLNGTTEGFSANSEHFVILFASAGLLLMSYVDAWRAWRSIVIAALAGVCMGVAYLMKQHGIVFAVFGVLAILCVQADRRTVAARCVAYAAGAALAVGGAWLHLALTGRFDAFWFWTVEYARAYAGDVGLQVGSQILVERARSVAPPVILILALAGVGVYEVVRHRTRQFAMMMLGLLLLSIAGVSIGFYFRPHYFRLLFPVIALLSGAGAYLVARYATRAPWQKGIPVAVVAVACGFTLVHQRALLFADTPVEASRRMSGINPFPESLAIAEYLRERTGPEDTIAVFGSEPQMYFYARRRAATAHIYTYQVMEPHPYALAMQREMIGEIEAAAPAYIVMIGIPTSWLVRPDSERLVFEWFEAYIGEGYEIAWRLEFVLTEEVAYVRNVYEDAARKSPPNAPFTITIYRRIDRDRE